MQFSHGIEPVQLIETVIYKGPCTLFVVIDFALPVVGAAAGAVYQAFVAGSDGTDPACLAQDAGAALGTDLIELP